MGISNIEFQFLKLAFDAGHLATVGSILEFGESNTHNLDIEQALRSLLSPGQVLDAAITEARIAAQDKLPGFPWARLLYRVLFANPSYVAIDLEPRPPAVIQQDLNDAFDLGRQFDLCINNGTSEHVFNQSNFYRAMHDHTRAAGLMIHWTPCIGWINHGLYNVQPGFFFDLARENNYEILTACLGTRERLYGLDPRGVSEGSFETHPDLRNALALVLMRKREEKEFRLPMQTTYQHLTKYVSGPA